jgi:hypothetical protein
MYLVCIAAHRSNGKWIVRMLGDGWVEEHIDDADL